MKTFMRVMSAVLFNIVTGAIMATAAGIPAWMGSAGMTAIGAAAGMLPIEAGVAKEGVYTEIWTGEIIKALRGYLSGSWLDGIPDASSIVENDLIHLVEAGVDPDVLVNNTTYPIPLQKLDDKDVTITLDKFQTKVTPVTDDELYAISYDKMGRVKESHGNAINDAKFAKAAHSLCPKANSEKTPVLGTTGAADENGRRRMVFADVVALKNALDKLKVPVENRRLVLCPDHANDLLLASQSFREQYNIDRNSGRIGMLAGFEVYEYGQTPVYDSSKNKQALDTPEGEGSYRCSFAFYTPRVFKATGSTKMYYSASTTDPEYQRNKIAFTHRFICMPKVADASAAIVSVSGDGAA